MYIHVTKNFVEYNPGIFTTGEAHESPASVT